MRIIDCPWEIENLDCKAVEVHISKNELFPKEQILDLEKVYDYLVVKIESGNISMNIEIGGLGYVLAETLLTITKNKSDWDYANDHLVQMLMKQLSVSRITDQMDFDNLMSLITKDMFTTDRIYLDPYFGPEYSCRRYKNWIKTEWSCGGLLFKHFFKGKYVGFSLCKSAGEELSCPLAGCFPKYQQSGIGLWIPLIPEIYPDVNYKNYTTHISANNFPVCQMYNRHGYEITKFEYVFIKHIHH